jgi:Predicted metal-binding, possibly nucleic acid-binding protein
MSKFELYNVVLKDVNNETRIIEFELDDAYFKKIDSPEVQRGNVKAKVSVQKKLSTFDIQFVLDGSIIIPCDRCLDDMEQPIHYKEKLQVKFGDKFAEEDEIVIVPESEGAINVAWFLYEFIVLNIPIKHVHATGECNKTMVVKLKKHITRQKDDTDDENSSLDFDDDDDFTTEEIQTDPRWDGLQNITENN